LIFQAVGVWYNEFMAYYKYIRICKKCNREYKTNETRGARYCRDCKKDLGIIKTKPKYSGHFYRKRKIVLERDKNRCRNCKSIKKLLVHHIDCDKKNNSFSNLITLCEVCHHALHALFAKKELKENYIFDLFYKMKIKKIQEKIDFLEKYKKRAEKKKKPKKFFSKQ
jgi:hypothetical protein